MLIYASDIDLFNERGTRQCESIGVINKCLDLIHTFLPLYFTSVVKNNSSDLLLSNLGSAIDVHNFRASLMVLALEPVFLIILRSNQPPVLITSSRFGSWPTVSIPLHIHPNSGLKKLCLSTSQNPASP